ncbi:hypothetical protein PsAD46_04469 [Pseudovibrio sp. Ad46]|uniref:hypothetical protein n=1 Tax=unclassified Pseudovibrio TaxID=2627060 RepID=UPI0007AE8F8B|nr:MULTISPECIES: hypothetical protein [unclassified Pseudovibrio]KZK78852.1 hypothetical protein PsAD46_04469 [Pseudovibrio sp. Ad46]KZK93672.1 hypothetical protein PsAD5_02989 [Pseudovibrio sp. Ad5]
MKHCVVTTFHESGYQQYGKRCIESFLKKWPDTVSMMVYPEMTSVGLSEARLQLLDPLVVLPKLQQFKACYRDNPFANGTNPIIPKQTENFRWDAYRFSNKVFAVTDAIRRCRGAFDQLIWLDADTVTHTQIPEKFLDKIAPKRGQLAAYLNRRGYPECGWVGYNLKHPEILSFADRFEQIYLSSEFLTFKENHDSYIFWEIVQEMERGRTASFKELGSRWRSGHIFIQSALGKYVDHLKGDRKIKGRSRERDALAFAYKLPHFLQQSFSR